MRKAADTTSMILDTVHLLFKLPLDPVKPKNLYIMKTDIPFVQDSFDNCTKLTLQNAKFLSNLLDFSQNDKDNINEETIELLAPYIDLEFPGEPKGRRVFLGEVAKKSSAALDGLCTWAAAMSDYHKQSKIVKPLLRELDIKMTQLKEAQDNLAEAERELEEVTAFCASLRKQYDV